MMIIKVSAIILFLASMNLNGQNLIGYSEKDIRQYMAENKRSMIFQNFINNSTFKYLKYTDKNETQTLLFFFK